MTKADLKPAATYTVVSAATAHSIRCNGMPLQTQGGHPLIVPSAALAKEIAKEWQAQPNRDKLNWNHMPLMQLAATAIDITSRNRNRVINQLLRYAETESLCHRADEPPELVKRQNDVWDPVLDWCAEHFKARLHTVVGIMPVIQSAETLRVLRFALEAYDDFNLTGLRQAVDVGGSLVLGLALAKKHLTADQVFSAAELDVHFQIEKWGADPAIAKRHADIRRDLHLCEMWFGLLTQP